ncbi:UBA domain-containing protein 7 [Tolypocladium ophioglossoides CBS 100239]|uniref:UBA domain-containing protein 7 n=1 Tax=Tolypocladium ophioglossoides (strain CBS 100239) TaxID=1163406 RepID=A0A0L0NGZ2_TOLOC|nr:UBA domain-containing protein 7 [Tolypocladium ophioglossoides CBS 100239]
MDDLSGLDWSKPTGTQPKPPPMNPSYPSLRPTPSPLGSGRSTPLSAQGSTGSLPKPAPTKPAQDSFSNLMNFGSAKASQNLTLAERQAQLEAEKRKKEEEQRKQSETQFGSGQQWDALGSRAFTPSPSLQPPAASNNGAKNDDDDDLFAAFNKDTKVDKSSHYPPPESNNSTPANGTQLDLNNPNAWDSKTGINGGNFAVEDDDPFGLNDLKPSSGAPAAPVNVTDDDDFLGDLARPVEEVRKKQQAAAQPEPEPEPGKPIEDEDSSSSEDGPPPPPRCQTPKRQPKANKDEFDRAIAQLVDYGFSPEDAWRGLAESGAGLNVQAAANWLLDDAHRKSKAKSQGRSSSAGSARTSNHAEQREAGARGEADLAKSAASVGNSLFKTANSLWKTGQKKMQQAVADFQQDGEPSQPKWMRDAQQGRTPEPRLAGASATDEALALEAEGRPKPVRSNNRQAADARFMPESARRPSPAPSSGSQGRNSPAPRWQQQFAPPVAFDARSRLNRLTSDDDSFSSYVSANRRKKAAPPPEPSQPDAEPDLLFNSEAPKTSRPIPQRPAQRDVAPPAKRPQAAPTPPRHVTPQPTRRIPPIDPVALQSSTKHRLEGTAHFKRGDYATAHSSYSSSISAVPPTHPLMIVLLTNRALTALKTGEQKQAVADADEALKLIGPGNGQGENVVVKGENGQEEDRDMKDLHGKALSRKAEALEQMEKWADAGAVWQQCVEAGVGGPTAVKGRQRCQNALAPKATAAPIPAAKPRPKPSATASLAPQKSSEAVTRLREANQAAAREDDEKFALSEKVDAKVSAWRDGKRENLRALLGSMDKVLWESSGWKNVGMHELVMANKVMIVYMKAIAKTHPDKVRTSRCDYYREIHVLTIKQLPQGASTEVRLIAGLVFSTLNESWDKFKAANGL